ncbi:BRCT domain-containing protein [Ancylobacter sp. Lp-2]|uniref:BRCT domain-containing protein n=1 Tax=Ancylobacter sp. Lp-2 TaxID=2881339 RepID=UPI001E383B2D|nr:BRCT domain-containing protein [Ancylobacter sp. Lp-2]MCB4769063.1 BRCT domain-containing protein [Ancylobacter sp. Lp-2]
MDEAFLARVNGDRLTSRQIDELIGISRGLIADGQVNEAEVRFLQTWLAANLAISAEPLIHGLYARVATILADGVVDEQEKLELFETLESFSAGNLELGEVLKSTSLPLCRPAPALSFAGKRYCFTGTFTFGQRKHCEAAVTERGAQVGNITQKTQVLVIGAYATESWKHSSFGNKILQAVEWRSEGLPIPIVSEEHWRRHL